MTTKVAILLAAPVGQITISFRHFADAVAYVAEWRDTQKKRIETNINVVDTMLYEGWDLDDPSLVLSSVMGQYIIGMYVAKEVPSAQERLADAAEKMVKQATQGDEWKEDD